MPPVIEENDVGVAGMGSDIHNDIATQALVFPDIDLTVADEVSPKSDEARVVPPADEAGHRELGWGSWADDEFRLS